MNSCARMVLLLLIGVRCQYGFLVIKESIGVGYPKSQLS